ncbi:AEC family transporter [Companilactobacillus mishanensis]|uniref:AEC family transporter n=1 Tax=Companilactobacillus mishanensis TaxID=2486008 RepID=A0A5P0ZHR3_9LACO|nr:AEC family transporter [Companilactobacillus mishanensis]MQS45155.1 AEC family transporter [Companilactobacillus mishanensis]MQS52591.1 AEC family transporter [Companilactobacillus mishanensis]MQS89994.1 AEC family transporter [Companilactobacillus mishanensis]
MGIFVQSVQGILIIIGLIAVGYVLARRGWFSDEATSLIAKLVTQVALPTYMIYTITHDFTASKLIKLLPDLVIPVLSMTILIGISILMIKILHVNPKHKGLFSSMFFNSNTVFVGLPVNMALFGTKSLPYVLVYYMANTTFFWTLGTYLIQVDGEHKGDFSLKKTLGKLFSPPLLGFIIGLILVLLNVNLPGFVMSDFQYLGNLTIPLSMLFIGISIAHAGLTNVSFHKDNLGILFGRFIAAPLVMAGLFLFIPGPSLMKQVFIIQSAMPVMTNAPVVARLYHADSDYAAIMVTETTLASLVVVPILMMIIK